MVLSTYAKQRIVALRGQGMSNSDIASCLANEGEAKNCLGISTALQTD